MLSVAACALSAAATYKVNIPVDVTVEGQELKAGNYRIDVTGDTAVLTKGKQKVQAKVHTEVTDRKISNSSIRYVGANGNRYNLAQISIGGSNTKLIFEPAKSLNSGL